MKILILGILLAVFSASFSFGAESDYFVNYAVTESTRDKPSDPWIRRYSEPFGARVGFGAGVVFSDHTIPAPADNCYEFSFSPLSNDGVNTLRQELEVHSYRGDNWCGPLDESKITSVTRIELTVLQGQSTVLTLPFLSGKEVQIELNQHWLIQR